MATPYTSPMSILPTINLTKQARRSIEQPSTLSRLWVFWIVTLFAAFFGGLYFRDNLPELRAGVVTVATTIVTVAGLWQVFGKPAIDAFKTVADGRQELIGELERLLAKERADRTTEITSLRAEYEGKLAGVQKDLDRIQIVCDVLSRDKASLVSALAEVHALKTGN